MSDVGAGPQGRALTERQRIAWLRLIRSDNVGPATFRGLINHFGSAEAAIDALPELSRRGGATRPINIASVADAERELAAAERFGARFVGIGEPGYPAALRQMDAAPPLLAVKGDGAAAGRPAVGLVGARNCSIAGAKIAALLAREIGRAGYTTVSGLARGIDATAHQASLATGTIAALAGGLDRPYPPDNIPLLDAITSEGGMAISEMPFGWEPRARDFPRRNRLIAGTGLGLVVVEAAARSGSLITARLAGECGRLVFAVPGSPLDPRCQGTNRLIKDGAILTTETADVLEALAPLSHIDLFTRPGANEPDTEESADPFHPPGETDRSAIISALGPTPCDIDDIVRFTRLPPATVHLVLIELSLAGRLQRHSNGTVSLTDRG